jgi:hypothetical protein
MACLYVTCSLPEYNPADPDDIDTSGVYSLSGVTERIAAMRRLIASVFLMILSATPGMAKPYPWCARSGLNGGSLDCMYVTLGQCQATISGLGGDCVQNPAALYIQAPRTRNGPPPHAGWQGGGWQDDGSNLPQKRNW